MPRNVPATGANAEETSGAAQAVRRTQITVEREVCSVEVHGTVRLEDLTCCPFCGQSLAEPEAMKVLELATVEQDQGGPNGSTLRIHADTTSSGTEQQEIKDPRSDSK